MSDFNTGTIFLYSEAEEFHDESVVINASKDGDGVYLSFVRDEITPVLGVTLNSNEAQALIASLQAALQAHWGNA